MIFDSVKSCEYNSFIFLDESKVSKKLNAKTQKREVVILYTFFFAPWRLSVYHSLLFLSMHYFNPHPFFQRLNIIVIHRFTMHGWHIKTAGIRGIQHYFEGTAVA